MPEIFGLIYIFLHQYLAPFLFVIGLLFFVYGCIEYFIIGLGGDEGRAQHGKELLLRSISWFVIAIFVYLAIVFLGYIGTLAKETTNSLRPDGGAGVELRRESKSLGVPNAPRGND